MPGEWASRWQRGAHGTCIALVPAWSRTDVHAHLYSCVSSPDLLTSKFTRFSQKAAAAAEDSCSVRGDIEVKVGRLRGEH